MKTLVFAAASALALTALASTPALAGGCTQSAGKTQATGFQTVGHGHTRATPVSNRAARGTIVDVAVGAGSFGTLVAAVQAAGLVPTLSGPGPFTVFAPTDAAFAKLPPGTVESLLRPENRAQLTRILTYHVVPGRVLSTDLAGRTAAPATVQGAVLAVDGRRGVKVNGATVTTADVAASNGVIHVIDTVLMPPAGH